MLIDLPPDLVSLARYGFRRADQSAHTPAPAWRALRDLCRLIDNAERAAADPPSGASAPCPGCIAAERGDTAEHACHRTIPAPAACPGCTADDAASAGRGLGTAEHTCGVW